MTKIDIFSGFLGAGKTSLIKKLVTEAYNGQKLVLIENEFGEIGIDGTFMQDAGVEVTEMNSGCICCSLVGDFGEALKKVLSDFAPDRILIEPSGVGKLCDVIKAVAGVDAPDAELGVCATVVDVGKCKMYMKNFGEFFNDQIKNATSIVLSHTQSADEEKIKNTIELIREHNKDAVIIATDWDKLLGKEILSAMEHAHTLEEELDRMKEEQSSHHHHHDEECCCGEHHHHDEECCCGEHHHHHDEECHCGEHHHHHDEECRCGEHHHHHADEVFSSWGKETANKYTKDEIRAILCELSDFDKYGMVLRAKGVVDGKDGKWVHFDYVPDGPDVRDGSASVIGRICVIGTNLNEENLSKLFNL